MGVACSAFMGSSAFAGVSGATREGALPTPHLHFPGSCAVQVPPATAAIASTKIGERVMFVIPTSREY